MVGIRETGFGIRESQAKADHSSSNHGSDPDLSNPQSPIPNPE